MEVKIGMSGAEVLFQELHLLLAQLKPVVTPIGDEEAKRKGNAPQATADLEHGVAVRQPAVDTQDHAPLFRPSEPVFQDRNSLQTHEREWGNEVGFVSHPPRPVRAL